MVREKEERNCISKVGGCWKVVGVKVDLERV